MLGKILVVDGHSVANRAFFGVPKNLTAPDGTLTNAIHGFFNTVFKFYDKLTPDRILVSFDVKGKNFRHNLDERYKSTRQPTDPQLVKQIKLIQEMLIALHIPVLTASGYEADDIVATLARQAREKGDVSYILSGDRDLLALVRDDCHQCLMTTRNKKSVEIIYTPEKVQEDFGIRPEQMWDYKALVGDRSDNIPGVAGIGEKTAVPLIQAYGNLDGIYEHIEEISAKGTRTKLVTHKDDAYLSRKLAMIDDCVPNLSLIHI